MQKNTDRKKTDTRKLGAILSAVLVGGYFLVYTLLVALLTIQAPPQGVLPWMIIVLVAAMGGAVVWGIAASLKRRLEELRGGEEDEAKQY